MNFDGSLAHNAMLETDDEVSSAISPQLPEKSQDPGIGYSPRGTT